MIKRLAQKDENDEYAVERRGFEYADDVPSKAVNITLVDDTGEIFCKVGRLIYEKLNPLLEKCKAGESLVAFKGPVPSGFRMIDIKRVVHLGEMEDGNK
jgi:hypothetical protein